MIVHCASYCSSRIQNSYAHPVNHSFNSHRNITMGLVNQIISFVAQANPLFFCSIIEFRINSQDIIFASG
jgi:hypothetical protein